MRLQPAALDRLTALAPVLAGWGRWYLFGAQAVVAYGVPRLSAEVDVTLALVPDEPERFARDMRAAGFVLRVEDPDFVRRPKDIEDANGLWHLHGRTLDAGRIRDTLHLLEEALGQSDLLPVFDGMVRHDSRAEKERG